jgi:hypothetical protein
MMLRVSELPYSSVTPRSGLPEPPSFSRIDGFWHRRRRCNRKYKTNRG